MSSSPCVDSLSFLGLLLKGSGLDSWKTVGRILDVPLFGVVVAGMEGVGALVCDFRSDIILLSGPTAKCSGKASRWAVIPSSGLL